MTNKQLKKANNNFLRYGKLYPNIWDRIKVLSLKRYEIPASGVQNINWGMTISGHTKLNFIKEGYDKSAIVYSIVRKIAKTCSYAPWGAYKVVDDESFKRYKSMQMQDVTREGLGVMRMMRHKALKPVNDVKLNDLMSNPNPTMDGTLYHEGLFTFKLLTGDAYEWANLLEGGSNGGKPHELWLLPSQDMAIATNGRFPVQPTGFILNGANPIPFRPEEVLHTRYFNPNYDFQGTQLYGFSPLQAAWLNIQSDNDAKGAAIEMLQNRGPRSILAMKDWTADGMGQDIAKEQAGLLKERWRQNMLNGSGDVVPIAGDASLLQVGLKLSDLKILEIGNYAKKEICNVFGVNEALFNGEVRSKLGSGSEMKERKKDFILNTVLTELNQLRSNRNQKLHNDWGYKNSGIVLDYDSSVYMELQEDMAKMVEWLEKADWYTKNEKRAFMGDEEIEGENADKLVVNRNQMLLENLEKDSINSK